MLNNREAALISAVECIKARTRFNVKRIHSAYFKEICGDAKLRALLRNSALILNEEAPVQERFLQLFRELSQDSLPNLFLYNAIRRALKLPPSPDMARNYVGDYLCYRHSPAQSALVSGKFRLFEDTVLGGFYFTHKSEQRIRGRIEQFDHEGVFFALPTRLYLVGAGQDRYGSYFRPMHLSAVDDPRIAPMVGVVMLEAAGTLAPISSKTVLIHTELEAKKRQNMDETAYAQYIEDEIANESKMPDVLYGWGKQDDMLTT